MVYTSQFRWHIYQCFGAPQVNIGEVKGSSVLLGAKVNSKFYPASDPIFAGIKLRSEPTGIIKASVFEGSSRLGSFQLNGLYSGTGCYGGSDVVEASSLLRSRFGKDAKQMAEKLDQLSIGSLEIIDGGGLDFSDLKWALKAQEQKKVDEERRAKKVKDAQDAKKALEAKKAQEEKKRQNSAQNTTNSTASGRTSDSRGQYTQSYNRDEVEKRRRYEEEERRREEQAQAQQRAEQARIQSAKDQVEYNENRMQMKLDTMDKLGDIAGDYVANGGDPMVALIGLLIGGYYISTYDDNSSSSSTSSTSTTVEEKKYENNTVYDILIGATIGFAAYLQLDKQAKHTISIASSNYNIENSQRFALSSSSGSFSGFAITSGAYKDNIVFWVDYFNQSSSAQVSYAVVNNGNNFNYITTATQGVSGGIGFYIDVDKDISVAFGITFAEVRFFDEHNFFSILGETAELDLIKTSTSTNGNYIPIRFEVLIQKLSISSSLDIGSGAGSIGIGYVY
ncbi:MAG: hypothetical protein KU37_10630 [Sulfuricurvum sp. PC08-66]|nr:MAG: hypothetical protein KU37_10630 [Sulfuricurvum sp. PC08-66]